jgi:2-polyprenyl-6-methoxyphenol hydroxylase-like FAD-dependent oxidoreductase
MKAIIIGAGIGGLTTALFLHKQGIEFEIYEAAPMIQDLGVGINLMPNAMATFDEIGMLPSIESAGVAPSELYYRTSQGMTAWTELRGRDAGLSYPQVSIHRGRLQRLLYTEVVARTSMERVHTDRKFNSYREVAGGVEATFVSTAGDQILANGDVLIGADGINSALRASLYPDEGNPRWSGRLMWRGTANWPAFGEGKHFVVAGTNDARLVLFPIAKGGSPGTMLTNWVFVHRAAADGASFEVHASWDRRADRKRCLAMLETFCIPDLDVHALASATSDIWEFAMSDRPPLPRWSFGRVTLMGDAAHPMYPFGGNGAAQAILDARSLGLELSRCIGDPVVGLKAYERERREKAYAVVMINRQGGPERVIDFVTSRLTSSDDSLDAVASFEERKAIVQGYSQIAGYSPEHLQKKVS